MLSKPLFHTPVFHLDELLDRSDMVVGNFGKLLEDIAREIRALRAEIEPAIVHATLQDLALR
jgi:hypothetical protein